MRSKEVKFGFKRLNEAMNERFSERGGTVAIMNKLHSMKQLPSQNISSYLEYAMRLFRK